VRTPMMAGNWKMHMTSSEAAELAGAVRARLEGVAVEVVLAPAFPSLPAVRDALALSPIAVAAQDMHWAGHGAFTGEVSPLMVAEFATHVLLGHSERRRLFHEVDSDVGRKVHAALHGGLVPILCVGETAAERDAGETDATVSRQVAIALEGVAPHEAEHIVIAYEPVWAIGSGRACEPAEAARVCGSVRAVVAGLFPTATGVRVLYGGSVTPGNIDAYMAQAEIDGALVGGASLDADSFAALARAAQPGAGS
jgi:triosephosphate isomerase (TIM)